jgi:hypothetical protein
VARALDSHPYPSYLEVSRPNLGDNAFNPIKIEALNHYYSVTPQVK